MTNRMLAVARVGIKNQHREVHSSVLLTSVVCVIQYHRNILVSTVFDKKFSCKLYFTF